MSDAAKALKKAHSDLDVDKVISMNSIFYNLRLFDMGHIFNVIFRFVLILLGKI